MRERETQGEGGRGREGRDAKEGEKERRARADVQRGPEMGDWSETGGQERNGPKRSDTGTRRDRKAEKTRDREEERIVREMTDAISVVLGQKMDAEKGDNKEATKKKVRLKDVT